MLVCATPLNHLLKALVCLAILCCGPPGAFLIKHPPQCSFTDPQPFGRRPSSCANGGHEAQRMFSFCGSVLYLGKCAVARGAYGGVAQLHRSPSAGKLVRFLVPTCKAPLVGTAGGQTDGTQSRALNGCGVTCRCTLPFSTDQQSIRFKLPEPMSDTRSSEQAYTLDVATGTLLRPNA